MYALVFTYTTFYVSFFKFYQYSPQNDINPQNQTSFSIKTTDFLRLYPIAFSIRHNVIKPNNKAYVARF
jgi:hypothetical protein